MLATEQTGGRQRINIHDAIDLEDVYDTERHLLYVACTRARDHLP
jgi:ATP-dependent exoDNAse (exonuclease V) beta subunit